MKKKKNKGFSVIEIVLVLGVIGILSSFIAPKVRDYLAMAKDSKAINILQSLRMANETYYLENGNYPTSKDGDMSAILEKISKYMGSKLEIDKTEFLIDVGGSKESVESKVIKYGGKVKIELDEDKAFKLTPDMDTYPISIRGEKWSEL